jgi:hypothetical protein
MSRSLKKIYILIPAILLLAAACNKPADVQPVQEQASEIQNNSTDETASSNPQNSDKETQDVFSVANSRRRADIGSVRVMLIFYHDKYNKYPIAVGNTPEQRWQNLSDTIVTKEDLEKGLVTRPLTQDPRQKETGYSYDYKNSPAQDNFVLKARFELPDSTKSEQYLNTGDDLDGIVNGLDCDDPSYCVKLNE